MALKPNAVRRGFVPGDADDGEQAARNAEAGIVPPGRLALLAAVFLKPRPGLFTRVFQRVALLVKSDHGLPNLVIVVILGDEEAGILEVGGRVTSEEEQRIRRIELIRIILCFSFTGM